MSVATDASGLLWQIKDDLDDLDQVEATTSNLQSTPGDPEKKPMQDVPAWAWIVLWLLFDLGASMVAGALLSASGE